MVEPIIKHSYVEVNGSFVHLKQYGRGSGNLLKRIVHGNDASLAASKKDQTQIQHLVIFVPGNPGALGVYHDFLSLLSKQLKDHTTILAISHNNFDHPDHVRYPADERIFLDEKELNFVEKTRAKQYLHDPYHMELQVLNKSIILRRVMDCLSGQPKVTFVGHSIGCYVILRLLQDKQLAGAHAGSILIHPALENLALTEKGQYFDRAFRFKLDLPMKLAAFLLDTLLPRPLKLTLTRRFCGSREFAESASGEVLESMMQLACSQHLAALIRMAKSELSIVKQLDCEQMIKPHVPKLRLYYALEDQWVDRSHRSILKRLYGDEIHIEERDTLHAFMMDPKMVADYAEIVANFVSQT